MQFAKKRLFITYLGKYLYSLIFLSRYNILSKLKNMKVININYCVSAFIIALALASGL